MSEPSNEFLHFFLDEAGDALTVWEKACLELERTSSVEAKEELYRAAHNLKSGSGAVGLAEFNHLVHQVEDLIAKVLAGEQSLAPAVIGIFLRTHALLARWIDDLKNAKESDYRDEVSGIERELAAILTPTDRAHSHPGESEADTDFNPALHLLQSMAPRDEAEAPAPKREPVQPVAAPPPVDARSSAAPSKSQESIRVAAPKLDQLIQLVGELSTQQAIVWHGRQSNLLQSKSCDNAIQLIQKIAKDLQGLALSLRMQPLQNLFQRLERSARDVARDQEKLIDVVISGEHVEVDRTVIERMAEALNHVIRNAVDHGIERPGERLKQGKSETAVLRLEALQETNGVTLIISDDGRGLNTDKIRAKAIESHLIEADAKLDTAALQRLIFHAGLSTAEKLTDISGRGVGMDVVKTSVENIGGAIDVSSQPGQGTSFAIALPATLSIIDALIIAVDSNRYAIPVQDVSEIIDQQSAHIEEIAGFGRLLSLRDQLIPVERLKAHLPSSPKQRREGQAVESASEAVTPTLIIRGSSESLAFEVDTILGQQPVTVRRLPQLIAGIAGYTGGTILGDGDPCVILNLPALMSRHYDSLQRQQATPPRSSTYGRYEDQEKNRTDANENRILIFEVAGREFGTPLLRVNEILRDIACAPIVGAHPFVLGSLQSRGSLLPVYDLGRILGLETLEASSSNYIILKDEGSVYAIQANRVTAVSDVEALSTPPETEAGAAFTALHGHIASARYENRLITLIDLQRTIRQWQESENSHRHAAAHAGPILEVS